MEIDIYKPRMMLMALKQMAPVKRFFLNTFFRNVVTHTTEKVELDIYKGTRRLAAYVNPIKDGKIVEREGFETFETRPAYIKERTALRVSDTRTRSIGENIYNASTPEERAAQILGEDLAMLEERVARREEQMCAEAITTGKVVVKGDGWDALVDFGYKVGENIKSLTGAGSAWNSVKSDPMKNLDDWRLEISRRCGISPNYCIVGRKVAWAILRNKTITDQLDKINMMVGRLAPAALPNGISYIGELYLPTGNVQIYSYDEVYNHPATGEVTPLVPDDMVILGSDQARCQMNYGLIQNLHSLQAVPRFPLVWTEPNGSARFVQLESAPMPNIYQVDAFTVAHVIDDSLTEGE
jgi:hypothetical protein